MTHLHLLTVVGTLFFATASAAAQSDERPELDEIELGQGWLGVALQAVDAEGNRIEASDRARSAPGTGEGTGAERSTEPQRSYVQVTQVFPRTPAETAGLRVGDLVLRFDDHDLVDVQDLITRVQTSSPGRQVTLTLQRDDETVQQPVLLGLRPDMDELLVSIFVDSPAPSLSVNNLADDSRLALPEGSVIVLDFWATWCGPCRRALPELNQVHARFASQGVHVIGISNEDPATIREFTAENAIDYTVAYDPEHETTHDYFITAYPTVFVIDAAGTIRHVFIGGSELSELEASLEALTNGDSAQ